LFDYYEETRDFSFTQEEREDLFGYSKGLHSKKTASTIYDLRLTAVKIECLKETLRSLSGEVSYTKKHSLGPEGSQMTWSALAKLVRLIAEYAIPMERVAKLIGQKYFGSSQISKWFIKSAAYPLPIYIAAGKHLALSGYLKMDDTSGLVLNMRNEAQKGLVADKQMTGEEWEAYQKEVKEHCLKRFGIDLVTPVLDAFGRVSQRVGGVEAKTGLNITLISGKLVHTDHKSKFYFYRTHFGQAGNLLSRILEYRPKNYLAELTIQSDCSTQNNIELEIASMINAIYIGCLHHARRPCFRYRDRDPGTAFCLLRCFAILARLEEWIQRGPLTEKRILKLRKRYGRKIWALMLWICHSVVKGQQHPFAKNKKWKKGDKIYSACAYMLRHRKKLTYYLGQADLDPDNGTSEQGLRGEKLIEASAHFRKSESGRIALDIHRSMIASCNACGLQYEDYLQEIFAAGDLVKEKPEQYFPHVIASTQRARASPNTPTEQNLPEQLH
jgi:hypothetical protein